MYTQCPNCRTIFQIDEDALQASLGIVRCGHCSERFDALRTLTDTLPADPAAPLPEHDPAARTPTLTEFVATGAGITARPAADTMDAAAAAGVEAWIAPQAGERARALIADAAGIPADAIAGDPAWQVLDVPVQAKLIEQDLDLAPAAETLIPEPAIEAAVPTAAEPMTAPWEVGTDFASAGDAAIATVTADDTAPTVVMEADAMDAVTAEWEVTAPEGAKPDPPLLAADATAALAEPEAVAGGNAIAGDAEAEPGAAAALEAAATTAVAEPVYVPPRHRALRDGLWIAGCVLLALVLAGQIAWAQRSELVRNPATRAWTLGVCSHIDCRLPPIRSVAQLELMSRDVRRDPDRANGLLITATVRNNAPFRQPWPVVVVRMTDIDDNVVAMRRFLPADYLHNAARRRTGIAPGATAAVAFAVADPGKRATGFRFNFE